MRRSWRSMGASAFALAVAVVACSSSSSQGVGVNQGCSAGTAIPCTCTNGSTGMATCAGAIYGVCQCGGVTPMDAGDASLGTPEAAPPSDATPPTDSSTMDVPLGDANEAGNTDLDAPDDAAFGTYMGPCSVDGDCPIGDLCHNFPSKGLHCTKTCELASDCPAPSPGCTPNGVCALP
jgi:hypothetical protein